MRASLTFAALLVAWLQPAAAWPAPQSPPPAPWVGAEPRAADAGSIRAVVVKSWGTPGDGIAFEQLNRHWDRYGSIPVYVDYQSLRGANTVTVGALQASRADVVIVSDPAGGLKQWSPAEVQALETYARAGHDLVGSGIAFLYSPFDITIDNRELAAMFGISSSIDFCPVGITADPDMTLLEPGHCLFRGLPNPFAAGGYPFTQAPSDSSWSDADLAGARFLARSADGRSVVTEYSANGYRAFYVSFMPEYQNGDYSDGLRWLYGALTCSRLAVPAAHATWGRLKSLYR